MNTQKFMIAKELVRRGRAGEPGLTQLEALTQFGVGRLASRIFDLKMDGYIIDRKMVPVQKANGETAEVASYSVDPKCVCHWRCAYAGVFLRAVQLSDLSVFIEQDTEYGWKEEPGTRRSADRVLEHEELLDIAKTYKAAQK